MYFIMLFNMHLYSVLCLFISLFSNKIIYLLLRTRGLVSTINIKMKNCKTTAIKSYTMFKMFFFFCKYLNPLEKACCRPCWAKMDTFHDYILALLYHRIRFAYCTYNKLNARNGSSAT